MQSGEEIKTRLEALRSLLKQSTLSTQEELREKLEKQSYTVTQSTISRDLRKLSAVRAIDSDGRTVYRLPEIEINTQGDSTSVTDLVRDIEANQFMVVIHTSPGSASLVARHLDQKKPAQILGTIAGDDTIFVAPHAKKTMNATVQAIRACFQS